jgi:hypothetical protein
MKNGEWLVGSGGWRMGSRELAVDLLHLPAIWQGSGNAPEGRFSPRPASPASKLAGVGKDAKPSIVTAWQ